MYIGLKYINYKVDRSRHRDSDNFIYNKMKLTPLLINCLSHAQLRLPLVLRQVLTNTRRCTNGRSKAGDEARRLKQAEI